MASFRLLKSRILPVLFLLFFSAPAWATHIFGIDFYYSYVSGNTYRVYLVIYGDCSGAAFPSLPTSTPQVRVYNGSSLFSTFNLAVQPPSNGIEVTPVCPADVNNTTCVNPAGTIPGIKKFVYAGNITLNTTSTVWRFVFTGNMGSTSAGRSTSITNILMGASGSTIQLTDTLNNSVYTNSSTYYTTIPTPFYCINRPANFNPGAVDPNSDSLVYNLVAGVDGTTGSPVTYIAPYTPTAPIGTAPGTYSFSNSTGQLAFTPNIVQKALVVYNVEEYRDGVMVGTSQREMTVVVIASCSNTPPNGAMTGATAGTIVSDTHINVCNNVGPFSFQINPTDPEGDTVDMTVAGLPPGATFSTVGNGTTTPLGTFSWNTTGVAPGNYTFYITYQDRGCPITSNQTIAYTITVMPVPTGTVSVLSPATCVAQSAVQVTPGGPTSPYAINVLSGSSVLGTFPSVTGAVSDSLAPGSYSITITNSQNCTSSYPLTIAPPANPSVSAAVSQPLCTGNTGAVTITATGGVAPYSYAVNSGAWGSTNVFSGLTAGTYAFHIKGSNQCTHDTTITIVNPLPLMVSASAMSPLCNGMANGSVSLLGYNATGPFTYALGTGSYGSSNIFSGLAQGTYVFHVKNANGCIKDTTITLADSIHLGATVTAPAILCYGGTSPVLISGSGSPSGSYTYAYNSSPFVPTGTFSLTAGTYTLHVRDINTCHFDTAITIAQPPVGVVSATPTNVNCNGALTGSVSISASGGTPSYLYSISGGAFGATPTFGSLPAGTYAVQVKDAHGCIYSNTVTVSQPPPIVIDSVAITRPSCLGYTGSLHIYAHGGTPSLSYAQGSGTYSSSSIMSGLLAGTYLLHVRDANGCTKDTTVTITQPSGTIPLAIVRSPICSTVANGQVTLSGTGGTPAYTYALGSGGYSTTPLFGSLAAGTYLFHIKDANGCIRDTSITLADSIHIGATVSAPAILCNGGTSTVLISGTGSPSGSYTYAYNSSAFVPTGTFSLTAGSYILHVQDSSTCHFDTAITLMQPPAGVLSVTPTNITCNGGTNGSLSVSASGGTPSYLYSISGGAFGSSSTFSPLPAGTYVIQVRDSHGCVYSNTAIVSQPPPIVIDSVSITRPLCFGNTGSLHIYAHGGTSSLGYALGSGGYSPSGMMSGLAAGTYLLHVRDANGCIKDTTVSITQPAPIIPHAIVRSPMCSTVANGQVTLSGTGGTPAYSYALGSGSYGSASIFTPLAAGTYTFHIKDLNGCVRDTTITLADSIHLGALVSAPTPLCYGGISPVLVSGTGSPSGTYTYAYNSSAFVPTGTFSLTAGTYSLHVRDVSTCQFDTSITITQPPMGMVSAMLSNVSCNGAATGSVTVLAYGGTPSYLYNISGGAFGTSPVFGSLSAGTYVVQVKDAHGCIYSNTVIVNQPPPIVIDSVSVTRPLCFGNTGSLHIYAHGGTPSLNYAIGSGAPSPSGVMSGLTAGTYLLHVSDANGCTKDTTVTITQPSPVIQHAIIQSPVCNTLANGQITLAVSGGTPAYTYALGTGSYGPANVFSPLAAGTYTFHIKDMNGCSKDTTITLADSLHITASTTVSPALCFGGTSGTINAVGSGGTAPYIYAIGTGLYGSTSLFSGLSSGTYVVHIKDHNGCIKDTTAFIAQPTKLGIHISVTDPTCYGYTNGVVIATASGGTPAYQYALNTGAFTPSDTFSTVGAGTTHVQVKDTNGCLHDTTFTVHQPVPLTLSVSPTNITCYGANDGSLTLTSTGGVMPYRYSVNSSAWQTGGSFTGLNAGSYSIQVKDSNSCAENATNTLFEPAPLAALVDITNPTCDGYKDGLVTIHASGGTQPYTYAETGVSFQADSVFHRLDDGTYEFNIKDANGCSKKVNADLKGFPAMKANIDTWPTSCNGGDDGRLKVYASGGVAPFVYSNDGGAAGIQDTFTHLTAGEHTITITDSNGCRKIITATVAQPQPLAITFTVTDNKCDGYEDQGTIKADVTGGFPPYKYAWSNDANLNAPVNAPLPNGHYGLVVTDSNGCEHWDSTSVKYSSCCRPYIPNAFTPNGDGRNDFFSIGHTGDMIILEFRIYNRFGEEVYFSTDPSSGWNGYYKGIKADLGVYYYYARIICGNDKNDKVIFLKGDVTLIQ